MCGIVGYYGPKSPKEVLLNGLKTLEYRGYDSAGVAIFDQGDFKRIRAEGKLVNLEDKLSDQKFQGQLGIGHTRWATHGEPSERNAHPHQEKGICIVHNGIIENYAALKDSLMAGGSSFASDTDSELVAHLISGRVTKGKDLFNSVLDILPELEGAYSILAVSKDHPDEMVAFKNGPPLVVGVSDDEVVVASDVQAIVSHTKEVIHLEDFEVVHIKGNSFQIYTRGGQPINKKSTHITWSASEVEKQGYAHYMLKEIFEQPRAVASALAPHINLKEVSVELNRVGFGCESVSELEDLDEGKDRQKTEALFKEVERIFIVACGTSFYAGMAGKYVFENLAKVPVEIDVASEFRYRNPVISKNTLVIVVSQSGETADTLAALRQAKEMGVKSLSICNVQGSSIDREAHGHLYMNAGVEIGVASTKAFVCSLTILNLVALSFAKVRGELDRAKESDLVQALLAAPSQMDTVLAYDRFFGEAAHTLAKYRGFLYMGRGVNFPIAMEGALKLKELAYMHAEGYAAGEMKHGPLALIDKSMAIVMLAPSDELYDKTVSNLEEAKARGGEIISVGSGDNRRLRELSLHYLSLPIANWIVNPLLEVIPLQLLSYHVADELGHDVDQPRNLAKSVTVE